MYVSLSLCVCVSDGEGREEEKGTGEIGVGRRGGSRGTGREGETKCAS